MIRLQSITLHEIRLPLVEPFETSRSHQEERRILLLEVRDSDGVSCWSECVASEAPNYLPETIDTAWLALGEWIIPCVLGRSFDHPREVLPHLNATIRGHNMAKAAAEMAAWALAAEKTGRSLAKYIGGERKAVATGIAVGIQADTGALVEKVGQCLEEGYQKIKLKIKPGADVEPVRAVSDAFDLNGRLMVDANTAYDDQPIEALRRLDRFGLMMIEQPLGWDDLRRHAELQARLDTPICLDESITTPERARDMIALGSGRIINIKPGRVGGFAASIAIHDLCWKHSIPVWCGGMLESGIGRAYNVALAALPGFTLPGDLSPSCRYWTQDIVQPEWTMSSDGTVHVPLEQPGLGVEVDADRIDNLTVRRETFGQ